MKNRKKIHDDWETPKELLRYIQRKYFGPYFVYDMSPLDHKFNAFNILWKDHNFVNPPYNRLDKEGFIIKAFYEMLEGKHTVLLLPVSTSTNIFHSIILPYANELEFLYRRVKFSGYNSNGEYVTDKTGQHDSMLVEFKPSIEVFNFSAKKSTSK